MKYLEIIYNSIDYTILTTKIHNKLDTVIPDGYEMKVIPYVKYMRKNLDSKLFNGKRFVFNPDYKLIDE